jgi:Ca2+-binding EF-hand superfamily protein
VVRIFRTSVLLLGGLVLMSVLFLGVLPVLMDPPLALAQPGGPGGPGGKGMKGPRDPNAFFNKLARGKDVIIVSEMPPFFQDKMAAFLKEKGITDGRMTRDLFAEYVPQMMGGRRKGGPPGGGGAPPSPGTPASPGADPAGEDEANLRARFKRLDLNGDGVLSPDEMPGNLRSSLNRYDKNKNGVIDFDEYKEYVRDRRQTRGTGGWGGFQPGGEAPVEEDQRPTVYRADNLPKDKNFPTWFAELDRDKDGQVGLYEWKAMGRPVDEFVKWDLNGDGFITAEEVLRYLKAQAKKDAKAGTSSDPSASGPASPWGPPGWPKGGGKGGKGGKGGRNKGG